MDEKAKEITKTCKHHGETIYVLEGRNSYRCKRCRVEAVTEARRKRKNKLVEIHGGECVVCGYSKCPQALQFHHLDPTQKEFGIAKSGVCRSFDTMKAEADKCVLVCANCHTEIEAGITKLEY